MFLVLLLILSAIAVAAFLLGRRHALASVGGEIRRLHSLPGYHGAYLAISVFVPAVVLALVWSIFVPGMLQNMAISTAGPEIAGLQGIERSAFLRDVVAIMERAPVMSETPTKVLAARTLARLTSYSNVAVIVLCIGLALLAGVYGWRQIGPRFRARHAVERAIRYLLIACSVVAVLTTIGIVLSLLFESMRFFARVPLMEFLFGTQWSPQTALRADQVGSSGAFGAVPLFAGTLLITFIAISVAAPVGLMSAIYLSDYASPAVRAVAKPMLEILAGIPTVVYGFFAALTVAPFIRDLGLEVGLNVSAESALAAGLVMGIMIIPFVSSLADDVINAVPQSLRDGSQGLGATKSETIRKVVLPAALPGIVSALLLAISRAIGETMIVVMAAGLAANLTINPLEAVTTVTVQIVTLLVGDQEFDSAKTLSAFALGLVLFVITLTFNVIALQIVKKYREQYD